VSSRLNTGRPTRYGSVLACRARGALVRRKIASTHGEELRGIYGGQVLIFSDSIPDCIVARVFYEAVGTNVDAIDASLVGCNSAQDAEAVRSRSLFHGCQSDPKKLLSRGVNLYVVGIRRSKVCSRRIVGVNRLKFHSAIGSDTRLVGLISRVHGVNVIQDATRGLCFCRRSKLSQQKPEK